MSRSVTAPARASGHPPRRAVYAFLTFDYDRHPSTDVIGEIHPKACPVILHPDDYDRWLHAPVEDAARLATPFPSQLMAVV